MNYRKTQTLLKSHNIKKIWDSQPNSEAGGYTECNSSKMVTTASSSTTKVASGLLGVRRILSPSPVKAPFPTVGLLKSSQHEFVPRDWVSLPTWQRIWKVAEQMAELVLHPPDSVFPPTMPSHTLFCSLHPNTIYHCQLSEEDRGSAPVLLLFWIGL